MLKGISRLKVFPWVLAASVVLCSPTISAQTGIQYIPASSAQCDRGDLTDDHDFTRVNPEWAPVEIDPSFPLPNNKPTIVEGFVAQVPSSENQNSQAPTEVSEEEIPWNHYTHDYTFKVLPDDKYKHVLASWVRFPGFSFPTNNDPIIEGFCQSVGGTVSNGTCSYPQETCPDQTTGDTCHHDVMEIEWENGSRMKIHDDDDRLWGALPEFVWPSGSGTQANADRVWIEGRWVFDCGHVGLNAAEKTLSNNSTYVKFDTEIHPPRAVVTFRANHAGIASEPTRSGSIYPVMWLPVTGEPVSTPDHPPTQVPVTEADIFVSGNGGGANDLCNIVQRADSSGDCSPYSHTGPVIPINNYNYVFDIYPPGTIYDLPDPSNSGAFLISRPTPDSSLQWRVIDQSGELPEHTCGPDMSFCNTVTPIICLIDGTTGPTPSDPIEQTLLGTTCPPVPDHPTRLRVILPFYNSSATYLAQTIMLGWDDVPAPPDLQGAHSPNVHVLKVTLDKFTVNENGRTFTSGDWRGFIDVGGQWRYISDLPDVFKFEDIPSVNLCWNGVFFALFDTLTSNSDGDCFGFTGTDWIVSVTDGTPIHVAVGGFDSEAADGEYCRSYSGSGCDTQSVPVDLAFGPGDRIGTYEFDLPPTRDYAAPNPFTIPETSSGRKYTVAFDVADVSTPAPPTSNSPQLGDPHFNNFISSLTPVMLSSSDPNTVGFQYRFHMPGGPLPTYPSAQPFPVHWTNSDLPSGSSSVSVYLTGGSLADGLYDVQYSANGFGNLLEPRHTQTIILDNTPPIATIGQPAATQYGRSSSLVLNYNVTDGTGSGVKSVTPKMDGQTAAQFGASLDSGQTIYLFSMSLGMHTFTVDSSDNVNNMGTKSVMFTITVTPDSLKGDVNILAGLGCIDNLTQSLLAKIGAAQDLIAKGQTQAAVNTLAALIQQIQAQAGKHISSACKDPNGRTFDPVQLLLEDARYLQLKTAGQLAANPILGWVVNSAGAAINGVTVTLTDSAANILGTATTDVTGFYYFAGGTSGLVPGANYTLGVAIPPGYTASTPPSLTFTWASTSVVGNFALN